MNKIIKETGERRSPRPWQKANNRLQTMCDDLPPKKRLVLVITSLVVFAVMAVYMAISSVYGNNQPEMNVQHIEGIKLHRANDNSINPLKIEEDDDE